MQPPKLTRMPSVRVRPWAVDEDVYNRRFETRDVGIPDRYLDKTARKYELAKRSVESYNAFNQKYEHENAGRGHGQGGILGGDNIRAPPPPIPKMPAKKSSGGGSGGGGSGGGGAPSRSPAMGGAPPRSGGGQQQKQRAPAAQSMSPVQMQGYSPPPAGWAPDASLGGGAGFRSASPLQR